MQPLLPLVRSADEWQRFLESARGGRVDGAPLLSVHGADPLPDKCLGPPDVVGPGHQLARRLPWSRRATSPEPGAEEPKPHRTSNVEATRGVRTAGHRGFVDAHITPIL
jgi:hypothetical protein